MKQTLIIYLILFSINALAEDDLSDEQIAESNCQISIYTERFTGIKATQIIYTKAASQAECDAKAKPHRHNFYPKEIKDKKLEIKFKSKN